MDNPQRSLLFYNFNKETCSTTTKEMGLKGLVTLNDGLRYSLLRVVP